MFLRVVKKALFSNYIQLSRITSRRALVRKMDENTPTIAHALCEKEGVRLPLKPHLCIPV